MDLLKKLLLRPTDLISQVSSAIRSPSAPRIILRTNSNSALPQHIFAGDEIRGILFVKCPPAQLQAAQISLKGSAKTLGFVSRLHSSSSPFPTTVPNDAFHDSFTRYRHLATASHPIVNDTRTLHPGRHLISPQPRLPRTLGPGRRPKPIISSPTFRFPFAIQVPQDAPSTHDDRANSAPSSIEYSLTARVIHPLPSLASSHSMPITVYEHLHKLPAADPPVLQQRGATQATWSLFEPGHISVTVTCPAAHLIVNARHQSLTLAIQMTNESPRKCTAVRATLYRRDKSLLTHEHRKVHAEHVVALADAEVPFNVPAYARGRQMRLVMPGIDATRWTPSSRQEGTSAFDHVRVEYFLRVKVAVDVGVDVEVEEVPIDVRVGERVCDDIWDTGRTRLRMKRNRSMYLGKCA